MEEMEYQSKRSGWAWNCLIDACYQEEDFVGRTSYLTRCVSIRVQALHTIQRYLAQVNVCWSVQWTHVETYMWKPNYLEVKWARNLGAGGGGDV